MFSTLALTLFGLVRGDEDSEETLDVVEDEEEEEEEEEEEDEDDEDEYDETDEDEDFEDGPKAGQNIVAEFSFPNNEGKVLRLGELTTVLVGLRNDGSDTYNVTGLKGFLTSPFDHDYYIQNFTSQPAQTNVLLRPGASASFEYFVQPYETLEPQIPYRFLGEIFYYSPKNQAPFVTTFADETITLIEPDRVVDAGAIYAMAMAASLFLAIIYGIYSWFTGSSSKVANARPTKKKSSAPVPKTEAQKRESYQSWLPPDETSAPRRRSKKSKSKGKK